MVLSEITICHSTTRAKQKCKQSGYCRLFTITFQLRGGYNATLPRKIMRNNAKFDKQYLYQMKSDVRTVRLGPKYQADFDHPYKLTHLSLEDLEYGYTFFTRCQFGLRVLWLPVSVCVSVCVWVCINHLLVRPITHHPLKLGSPNLDHMCKIAWLRSPFFWFHRYWKCITTI